MIFEIAIVEDQATASETLTDHLDTWAKERGLRFPATYILPERNFLTQKT